MGSQPSPPTLDTAQSKALTQADYDLKIKNTPAMTETVGQAGREEYARNIAFGLQAFADPSSIFQFDLQDAGKNISETNKKIADMGEWRTDRSGRRYNPTSKKWVSADEYQKQLTGLNRTLERQKDERTQISNMAKDPVGQLERTFKDEFKLRDNLLGDMRAAERSSAEYTRMQRALQKGLNAQTVGQRSARAAQADAATAGIVKGPRAAMAENVRDIRAGQVRSGALGQELMGRALEGVRAGGRLNAEAERDAIQAARQSMAARGMATGSAGAAAELLNRDSYRRAREMEDLTFASGVQGQDLERQFQNVGNQLTARQANQAKDLQLSLNDQDAMNQMRALGYEGLIGQRQFNAADQQQANLANMQAMNNMRQFNVGLAADTDRFNAGQRTDAQRFNVGMLQSSALASDNERARQLGLGQSAYNFALQTNPKMMLAGLGSPYANFTPQALGLMSNQNVQPIYSGGSFSSGGAGSMIAGGLGGAMSGAAAGTAVMPGWGTAIGGAIGLGAGLLGSRY